VNALPVHPDVIEVAASGYLAHLRDIEVETLEDGRLGRAARHLIATIEAALSLRSDLRASDIAFKASDLAGIDAWHALALIDQNCLGLGRDDAPVIFMGTEEAFDVVDGPDLALTVCLSVLWLCASQPDVLDAIDPRVRSNARTPNPRPYHLHPNDYYRIDLSPGRSTWECIARILRPDRFKSLLAPPTGNSDQESLGDLAYQIDVSAFPSKVATGGRSPHSGRIRFLVELAAAFTTARALVFHGGPSGEDRNAIASSFLGRPVNWITNATKRQWLAWDIQDGRIVMHTYALSGRIRNEYLEKVHLKLAELAPTR
jgi:hypothetical protein